MQFLPRKNERYVAALREYMHKRIANCGINEKRLNSLRKINLFSISLQKISPVPTDALSFCRNILTACSVELIKKGIFLKIEIWGEGIKEIDTRIVTMLIAETVALTVKSGGRKISLNITDKEIRITSIGMRPEGYPLKLIRKLRGRYFRIQNINAISIPAENCLAQKISRENDIKDLLLNPLSPVKVHLSHVSNRYFV